jgi:hypothetical protein
MIDPNRRAFFVEGVERIPEEELARIIGIFAAHDLTPHVLPRGDIRVNLEPDDELIDALDNLPLDAEYGYFNYEELLSFAQEHFNESGRSQESIKKITSLLWKRGSFYVSLDDSVEKVKNHFGQLRPRDRLFFPGFGRASMELFTSFAASRISQFDGESPQVSLSE